MELVVLVGGDTIVMEHAKQNCHLRATFVFSNMKRVMRQHDSDELD